MKTKNKYSANKLKYILQRISPYWRRQFTYILIGSRLLVFAVFVWVAMVMFKLNRPLEAIGLLMVISLYIILNKLDQLSGG